MKRQLLKMASTLVNSRRGGRSSGRRRSAPRKMIVAALSLMLVLVPLLGGRRITPRAQAQIICGGTDPNRIFQGCPLGAAYETSLENTALDDLLNVHQLPPADRSRLLGWQRGELRTLLYGRLQDFRVQRMIDQAVQGGSFLGGLAVGGIGGVGLAIAAPTALIKAIFPFAGRAFTISGAGAAGTGAASAAIGGAVLIVVVAIVIGVLRGIDVFEAAAIPGKLQEKLNEMQNAPLSDLAQLVSIESGKQEVFAEFILATLPDFPATGPVPAAQASDPQFRVRQEAGAMTAAVTINFKSWDNDNQSAWLNGGWFINQYKEDNLDKERWALRINYLNWSGELWSAGRAGANFIHNKFDDPTQTFQSPEINYQDWNGNKFTASVNLAALGIEALPVVLNRGHQAPGIDIVPAPQTIPVALVNSGGQAPNTLSVAVNNGSSATATGVAISNLSVDSNGRVTASLTAECTASAATFTLKVTDNAGQSKTASLAIQLSPLANRTPNPLAGALPDGEAGAPYNGFLSSFDILAGACTNVGGLGLSVTSGKLPPGLSLGAYQECSSGCLLLGSGIVGTPASGGRYEFTVRNGERRRHLWPARHRPLGFPAVQLHARHLRRQ